MAYAYLYIFTYINCICNILYTMCYYIIHNSFLAVFGVLYEENFYLNCFGPKKSSFPIIITCIHVHVHVYAYYVTSFLGY